MARTVSNVDSSSLFDSAIDTFRALSELLVAGATNNLLQTLPEKVCNLLSVPACILWQVDEDASKLIKYSVFGDVDKSYQMLEIDIAHPSIQNLFKKKNILSLSNVDDAPIRLADLEAIKRCNWVSLMSLPLITEGEPVGMLDVFDVGTRDFQTWEKSTFQTFANYATSAFREKRLLKEKRDISEDRERLQSLVADTLSKMADASSQEDVWMLLQQGIRTLVSSDLYISIAKLSPTGQLEIVFPPNGVKNKLGEGITGQALDGEAPVIANDVSSKKWEGIYIPRQEKIKAEMSIPLIANDALIREGENLKTGSKRIGVLNIESIESGCFDQSRTERLSLLTQHAALRLEKLSSHNKLIGLRMVEKQISKENDYRKTIEIVVKGIVEVLGFTWVNISLIDQDREVIRSEFTYGLSSAAEKAFKDLSVHPLDSMDIQANIVRSRKIEVPTSADSRLDKKIYKQFDHENLCRVFIPMIESSSDSVVGTVEAGYKRSYRPYVYEKDIQLLQGFVDYAVNALERKKSIMIDRITHEINSPIVGIRSHASFLLRRFNDVRVSDSSIALKLADILTDCELLLHQTRQIEYFLGKSLSIKPKRELVVVYRDIIIKTINQLVPVLNERNFSHRKITWRFEEAAKVAISTDKVMLSQVVYNLLMNAVKYAESDPDAFKILIEAKRTRDTFIVTFKDWGIGIKEEYADKVFQEGFRSPSAVKKDVGLGLGLSIASVIMKQLGGELRLVNRSKPTEFQMILPLSS